MLIEENNVKRAAIYFVYDAEGIIDDYIPVILSALRKHINRIVVVANGKLGDEGRNKLKAVVDDIVVRPNTGFDGWAYKTGIEYIGWDELRTYDELIMMNHTVMGPVNSFDEMFDTMDGRDLDFWGITKFYKIPTNSIQKCEYGYIPEHIQSYFICVRKEMLSDISFFNYWNEFPQINSYSEAVGKHEAIFTKKFGDMGFRWDSYVYTDDLEKTHPAPIMYEVKELVENRNCPVFKRRIFFNPAEEVLENSVGNETSEFIQYLKDSGKYDINLIWENILRTCRLDDIASATHLTRIIPSEFCEEEHPVVNNSFKSMVVILVRSEELFDELQRLLAWNRGLVDFLIYTDTSEKQENLRRILSLVGENGTDHVTVNSIQGTNEENYKKIIEKIGKICGRYRYFCFLSDQIYDGSSLNLDTLHVLTQSMFRSKASIQYIENLLESDRYVGMLVPAIPVNGKYYSRLGRREGEYLCLKENWDKLHLTVPMPIVLGELSPVDGVFWIKSKVLYKVIRRVTESRNIEVKSLILLLPYLLQNEGYYTLAVMDREIAAVQISIYQYYLRMLTTDITNIVGRNTYKKMIQEMKLFQKFKNVSNGYNQYKGTISYKIVKGIMDFRFPFKKQIMSSLYKAKKDGNNQKIEEE